MKIFIATDHGGWHLKEQLINAKLPVRISWQDVSNQTLDPKDDYPLIAARLAKKVARSKERGILICRTGVGMCIAANKIKGVRAGTAHSPKIAERSTKEDWTNILCLAGDFLTLEQAKKIITAWLKAKPAKAIRRQRRVKQIAELEKPTKKKSNKK